MEAVHGFRVSLLSLSIFLGYKFDVSFGGSLYFLLKYLL